MYKALIYKEWLKTRRVFSVSLIAAILVGVYVILSANSQIASHGMNTFWLAMILKDVSTIDPVKFIPAIIGMAMGIAQMSPEMSHKRLKLTLHLPYPQLRLVSLMLATGLLQLFIIFFIQAAVIGIYYATIMPDELVGRVLLTVLPWYLAGLYAYLFASSVCLEGTWRRRVIVSLTGIAVLIIMFMQPGVMAAYNKMIIIAIIAGAILPILSFGSITRFKEGLQD